MKEKIYTIPVNDAYRSACACPLCELSANVESSSLDYYLGPSLMEPDVRKSTNKTGFCGRHLHMMYGREINRLGLGLMLHTHLVDLKKDIGGELQNAAPASGSFMRGRDRDYKRNLETLADKIDGRVDSCIICDKIRNTMDRYVEVILWMYFEDAGFRTLFENRPHHCLHHTAALLRGAARILPQNQAGEFVSNLAALQNKGLDAMISDVEWFTLKFDYRNKDKPWGSSKDAIPRAISLLSDKGGDTDGNEKEQIPGKGSDSCSRT